ncbi:hypothetical protein PHYPSEUDO_008302 [Phytophthora pseudosyringae]|uniref:RxLR effector protein n=1 Tax=Phytophthora pseudosyringae TaxID=221518 RepID=A0A8T1VED3_9STRA|nr:hypothetical protein PHYPSEUDO_008302 [Phytophthora pseudosyringae]
MGLVKLFLVVAVLVLTSCDASAITGAGHQRNVAKPAPIDAVFSTTDGLGGHERNLRSDAATDDSDKSLESEEEREIVPASVRYALKKLVTKDDAIYTHGTGTGYEKEWWTTVLKYYRYAKNKLDTVYRHFPGQFIVWAANKQTPAMMYEKLNVIKTTGPYDKNYRTYIKYLRFYEWLKGPTYNPVLEHGPKFKTD